MANNETRGDKAAGSAAKAHRNVKTEKSAATSIPTRGATRKPQTPPNSVELADLPFDPPKPGMVVWAQINSLDDSQLPGFSLADYDFGVGFNSENKPGLWYRVKAGDLERGDASDWQFIWVKIGKLVETMSILTIGNLWIGNRLWSDRKMVWERPRGVPLVPEKEYTTKEVELHIPGVPFGVGVVNLQFHIAINFPRAWIYHETGCYLLRSSFPGHDFSADSLLNFYKIGEMITAKLYTVKPSLKDVQTASHELGITQITSQDIKNFYKVRSRDAAHDWLTAEHVQREDAVDCKMWAELMIISHWQQKGFDVVCLTPDDPRGYDPKKHGPVDAL